jgi:hypothetical protein
MIRQLAAALLMLLLGGVGAFAQQISVEHPTIVPVTAQAPGDHNNASAHKCCHSSSVSHFEIAMPLLPANMPCGSEHVCCVRPGPANFAEVPSTHGQQRPDACHRGVLATYLGAANLSVSAALRSTRLLPFGALSTVLRI